MKEYLNRFEDDKGNIIVKMVKMGMDIDANNNYRIRGIVPTDDGKYLFIELSAGHRFEFTKSNFPYMSKEEYNKTYPNEMYIHSDFCFRVDIPKDYFNNDTKEYVDYDRTSFYNFNYDKNNIIEFLKKFNKNIQDIKLVDKNYIDDYCNYMRFYRLYDERLKHKIEPQKIISIDNKKVSLEAKYICDNYNDTVRYEEKRLYVYEKSDLEKLKSDYGSELIDNLINDYHDRYKDLFEVSDANLEL